MTIFLATVVLLYATHLARTWIRGNWVPWYELRLQERAEGLPWGSLKERWHHPEDWISDEDWCRLLEHANRMNHVSRDRTEGGTP